MTNDKRDVINDELQALIIKARYFYKNNIAVHISFKNSEHWINGYIMQPFTDEYFMIDELEDGKLSDPIVFLKIKDIVAYQEPKNG